MMENSRDTAYLAQHVLIVGASHAGVNAAFSLRAKGWTGHITLVDGDPQLPYHRPPLSKKLLQTHNASPILLKAQSAYVQQNINLKLACRVERISTGEKHTAYLSDGNTLSFDKLVLATGCAALIPPISGIMSSRQHYTMRNFFDVRAIQSRVSEDKHENLQKSVVIIGAGYIGLEAASSFRALGLKVTVIERETSILSRVTTSVMSDFLMGLHQDKGVNIETNKDVIAFTSDGNKEKVVCKDGSEYSADFVLVGVGVKINTELAEQLDLEIDGAIVVNEACQSSHPDIFAIGDCTKHFNQIYNRWIRLESVQNAVDQAKALAEFLTTERHAISSVPWFWSDQYECKLQIVGLSQGYTDCIVRQEQPDQFSIWYFKEDTLLCVEAVNHAKSYVLGTQAIKNNRRVNKLAIANLEAHLTKDNIFTA